MGKIRVKTFGDEQAEKKQKNDDKKRAEGKKIAKAPGMKGGERVVAVGPSQEELEKMEMATSDTNQEVKAEKKKVVIKKEKKETRSKNYKSVASLVDNKKTYTLSQALTILPTLKRAKFDETVELHIITTESGISGSVTLPHGSGKEIKVAIADDKIISDVEKGKIEFDILLAEPQMMPKLARIAKFLGPKGLMPNPKNGTITTSPVEAAKKYTTGLVNFKTEAKNPLMHLTVGKISFGDKKLSENITKIITAVKSDRIKKAVLKSTMSPGLKIDYLSI